MTDTIAQLKQQIHHLEGLVASGALAPDAARTARDDLQRRLVEAVLAAPEGSTANEPAPPRSPKLIAGIAVFVLAFAGGGYAWLGSPEGWSTAPGAAARQDSAAAAEGAASGAPQVTMAQIEGMVAALEARLKERPDDAEGWLMLGRSKAVLGRFDEAVPAYRKLLTLQPKNSIALADLADALAMTQGQRFDGEPERLIQQALVADPDNLKALSLAGSIAFEKRDFSGAVRHWERVVQIASARADMANSNLLQRARENLAEARQLAGMPAAAGAATASASAPATAAPAAAGREAVTGRVELAPALAARAAPDDTVFIFARPAEGARMPLAILKKKVRDLPADFRLDDSLAMSPAAKLSGATRVIVGARVSKSGQAMPQPGDLEGLSAPMPPGATNLKLVISEVVR